MALQYLITAHFLNDYILNLIWTIIKKVILVGSTVLLKICLIIARITLQIFHLLVKFFTTFIFRNNFGELISVMFSKIALFIHKVLAVIFNLKKILLTEYKYRAKRILVIDKILEKDAIFLAREAKLIKTKTVRNILQNWININKNNCYANKAVKLKLAEETGLSVEQVGRYLTN